MKNKRILTLALYKIKNENNQIDEIIGVISYLSP